MVWIRATGGLRAAARVLPYVALCHALHIVTPQPLSPPAIVSHSVYQLSIVSVITVYLLACIPALLGTCFAYKSAVFTIICASFHRDGKTAVTPVTLCFTLPTCPSQSAMRQRSQAASAHLRKRTWAHILPGVLRHAF